MSYKPHRFYISSRRQGKTLAASRYAEAVRKLPCGERREGDELACHCGLRWQAGDERPPCPKQL